MHQFGFYFPLVNYLYICETGSTAAIKTLATIVSGLLDYLLNPPYLY